MAVILLHRRSRDYGERVSGTSDDRNDQRTDDRPESFVSFGEEGAQLTYGSRVGIGGQFGRQGQSFAFGLALGDNFAL